MPNPFRTYRIRRTFLAHCINPTRHVWRVTTSHFAAENDDPSLPAGWTVTGSGCYWQREGCAQVFASLRDAIRDIETDPHREEREAQARELLAQGYTEVHITDQFDNTTGVRA